MRAARVATPVSASASELAAAHFHLVRQVLVFALRRMPQHTDQDELESAGAVGLLRAAELYEPARGVSFPTYARRRIYGAMLDATRDMDRLSRASRRAVSEGRRTEPKTFSLSDPVSASSSASIAETVAAPAADPDRGMVAAELWSIVEASLDPRSAELVRMYHGLGLTMARIAANVGLTESRVSQLLKLAVAEVRRRGLAALEASMNGTDEHAGPRNGLLARMATPVDAAADWRTPDERAHDATLRGTWHRCRVHGLTQTPRILGTHGYCERDTCDEKLLRVHAAAWDLARPGGAAAVPPRAAPTPAAEGASSAPEPVARPAPPEPEAEPEAADAQETDSGDPATTADLIREYLRGRPDRTASASEVAGALLRLGRAVNVGAHLSALRQRRWIVHVPPRHWRLVREESPASRSRATAPAPRPAAETSQETSDPALDTVAPRAAPLIPGRERGNPEPAESRAPAASDRVAVRMTAGMRRALERLVARGFHGASAEEAAERVLAAALERRIEDAA